AAVLLVLLVHLKSSSWHFQSDPAAASCIDLPESTKVNCVNGSLRAVYSCPVAALRPRASFSWSNAGFLMNDGASTRTNSFPPLTDLRYQKRSLSTQVTGPAIPEARPSYFCRASCARR